MKQSEESRTHGHGTDVLVECLADGREVLGVGEFDVDAFAEGLDEVFHLLAEAACEVRHVLRVRLRGARATAKCRENSGKLDYRRATGSSSIL